MGDDNETEYASPHLAKSINIMIFEKGLRIFTQSGLKTVENGEHVRRYAFYTKDLMTNSCGAVSFFLQDFVLKQPKKEPSLPF